MLNRPVIEKEAEPMRSAPPASPTRPTPPPHPQSRLRGAAASAWRMKWRILTIVAALAAGAFWARPAIFGAPAPVSVVQRGEFLQTVVASGHVEAPFRVDVGSQVTGVVADVPVSEGQRVKAGDSLVILDDREARATVVQAEGVVAQAEARLRQLREVALPSAEQSLEQARATLLNAQKTYDRAAKLSAEGYATRAALDQATKDLDIARTQARNAEFQVSTTRPGGSDYVLAEAQLAQARAALANAQSRLGYATIKAPRDGVLISRNVERGNVVQPSTVLMKLSPVGETQLVVQIDEKNLGLIALGQKALASADAYPKSIFAAEVAYINPGVDLQRASVEVKLRVAEPPDYLRQDMTVSVDIEVARRPNAVVAPAETIREAAGAAPWVMVVENGRAKRQPIALGIVSAGKAEIVSGLDGGALVLPAASRLPAGAKVQPVVASGARP